MTDTSAENVSEISDDLRITARVGTDNKRHAQLMRDAHLLIDAQQAKLTKAVEWFKKLDRRGDALETFDPVVHEVVTAALAELEGGE